MFYVARCMNIIFNELRQQLVKYDVDTTRKIKFIHAIFMPYYYFIICTHVVSSIDALFMCRHLQGSCPAVRCQSCVPSLTR